MRYSTVIVNTNSKVSTGIYRIELDFADECKAGQFFMLRVPDAKALLPRPISVCDWQDGKLTLLYQVVGRGTKELSALHKGDILELTGPLGHGFPVGELRGKVALVSGGIGVAPMLLTAKALMARGCEVHALCGYRDETFLAQELRAVCSSVSITSETGRAGVKGYVTEILEPERYDAVLCCGPEQMMRIITKLCSETTVPIYVSLETKMACGIGACLVCACATVSGKNKRTCTDGPVFPGEEVDFDA